MACAEKRHAVDKAGVVKEFVKFLNQKDYLSPGAAAIRVLYDILNNTDATTTSQVIDEIRVASDAIVESEYTMASVRAACEIFAKFVTLTPAYILDNPDFRVVLRHYRTRAHMYVERIANSANFIANVACAILPTDAHIMVHGDSNIVLRVILALKSQNAKFGKNNMKIYVPEGRPECSGLKMYENLVRCGITATKIMDTEVAHRMHECDLVLASAEGVLETGGILGKIGTLNITNTAKSNNIPVYVVTESIKFIKKYPLNQADIPDDYLYPTPPEGAPAIDRSRAHPAVDYTPPTHIRYIITDLGIFIPTAVGDELVKLYT